MKASERKPWVGKEFTEETMVNMPRENREALEAYLSSVLGEDYPDLRSVILGETFDVAALYVRNEHGNLMFSMVNGHVRFKVRFRFFWGGMIEPARAFMSHEYFAYQLRRRFPHIQYETFLDALSMEEPWTREVRRWSNYG